MRHLVNWVEIPVRDMNRACAFYEHVLDVDLPRMELGGATNAIFPTDDRFRVFIDSEGNSIGLQHP